VTIEVVRGTRLASNDAALPDREKLPAAFLNDYGARLRSYDT
jgi:hypothetical protein